VSDPVSSVRFRRGRQWGPRRSRVLAVAVVAAVLTIGWLLTFAPLLAVRRVEVAGARQVSPAQVRAAAAVRTGVPLLRVDTAGVRRRVGELPPVAAVAVQRRWPATLRLRVTERQPAAVLVLPGGGVALVDRIGVVFGSAPAAPPGVPVLDVAAADPHDPATAAALTVVSELPRELAGQVRTVAAPSPTAVSLTLRGGAVVAWGDTRDAGRKSAALQALLKLRPVSHYDVSTPDVVTTR